MNRLPLQAESDKDKIIVNGNNNWPVSFPCKHKQTTDDKREENPQGAELRLETLMHFKK